MYYNNAKIAIKHWAEDDRPREKLIMKGRSALSDAELLAILIGKGSRVNSALDLGKIILEMAGYDLNKLARFSVEELTGVEGIGQAKAAGIIAAMELARRKKREEPGKKAVVNSSETAYEHMKPYLLDLSHEEFWLLCLNRRMEVVKTVLVSSGGVSGTFVDTRILFRHALQNLSSAILLCHNHPSGNANPSEEDMVLTQKIKSASRYLDISVADHIIFTNEGYFSFADKGIL
ncbi:DNA repair protein RadC [Leadbetterella sp. DM7]|uniref:RadC family protein n=1 Tax=Leadbetterella sp. DM7 TaxID=3235085 RepID=UPI00349E8196